MLTYLHIYKKVFDKTIRHYERPKKIKCYFSIFLNDFPCLSAVPSCHMFYLSSYQCLLLHLNIMAIRRSITNAVSLSKQVS